jgi:hypothetical protein
LVVVVVLIVVVIAVGDNSRVRNIIKTNLSEACTVCSCFSDDALSPLSDTVVGDSARLILFFLASNSESAGKVALGAVVFCFLFVALFLPF